MPNKLKKIVLDRVDLVPDGANPDAHIVLMKSKEAHVADKDKDAVEKAEKERLEKEKADKEKADAERVAKEKAEKDAKDEKERLEKEKADKERLEKEKADKVAKGEDIPAHIQKALDAQAEEIKKANERAEKAEKEVNIEKHKRETVEFVAKAKTDLPSLTGTAEEKGAILQSLYKGLSKEDAEKVVALLKTGDTAVRTLLSVEHGGPGDTSSDGTAVSDLKKKGEEIRKAEPKLTEQQAFRKACNANPDLYRQYQQERRTRTV